MSRQFIDDDLILWEVYSSTGQYSLPGAGRLVFLCVTDRERRPRSVRYAGDLVDSAAAVERLPDEELRTLLAASQALP
jgi:hypothetical protein